MNISDKYNMYFVAIMCPPAIDKVVLQFKKWMKEQFGCVVALRSAAHITIIPPFWAEMNKELTLQETLEAFESDKNELKIQLDGFSRFGKRVLFIRVLEDPELEEIKKQAEQHFARTFGDLIPKDDRPFHPHITIANRDLHRLRQAYGGRWKPGDLEKAWLYFSNKTYKENFSSNTISLLKLTDGNWKVIAEKNW